MLPTFTITSGEPDMAPESKILTCSSEKSKRFTVELEYILKVQLKDVMHIRVGFEKLLVLCEKWHTFSDPLIGVNYSIECVGKS